MWNWVSLFYLVICSCALSSLGINPAANGGWEQLVVFSASLTFPLFIVWMSPKTGFWKGALQLVLILAGALVCGFVAYLLWYSYEKYLQPGSEFQLFEALRWTFGESLAFYLYLDVMPAAIIAGISYPIGYLASFQLFRLVGSHTRSES
jgi:hypothetical protein